MKKFIFSFLTIAAIIISFGQLFAAEDEVGDVVLHFKKWDDDYTDLGAWVWGHDNWGGTGTAVDYDDEDDFGVFFRFENLPVVEVGETPGENDFYGFIGVDYPDKESGQPNWDGSKYTDNIEIRKDVVKANETVHIYVFQGNRKSTDENPRYYVADNDKYNLLLVYYDPSGSYEENLGVHNWSGWTKEATAWGSPLHVFKTAGETAAGMAVKAAMLHSDPDPDGAPLEAGLLIYAGGDENKKTSDIDLIEFLDEEPTLGDVGVSFVVSMGNGYTKGDNIFGIDDYETFNELAFTFRLLPFRIDDNGRNAGTFAIRPDQIFVEASAQITNPYEQAENEEEREDALELVLNWFDVKEKTGEDTYGDSLEIERVDFALNNETINDFVIVLKDDLDTSKEYTLFYDNQKDGDEQVTASVDINLDKDGPIITFPLLDADKVVLIPWGKPFDLNKFPLYSAIDDRDGDITDKVFVPKDSNSVLDTRKEGDYVITLEVSDLWGNVTRETFTFRVSKKVK